MTIIERKSERKKKAIMLLVKNREMSIAYALMEAERLNDEGKLLDKDYEELAEYLEAMLPVEDNIEVDSTEQLEDATDTNVDTIEETNEENEVAE